MNNLQRMIVIPPEIFERFKHIVLEDDQLSSLDKNMKSILHNKNLNDLNKWHLYRQNLINYSSMKRRNAYRDKFKWYPKHVEGVGVQTKRIFTKEKDSQNDGPQLFDKSTQTIEIPIIPEFKGVGEPPVSQTQLQSLTDDDDDTDDNDQDEVFTNEIEKEYDERDVLNIRNSDKYKTVEMKNGDVITLPKFRKPAKPIQKPRSNLRKASDGYLQTEIGFPKRKSTRPATVETISRSQSLRTLPWTTYK